MGVLVMEIVLHDLTFPRQDLIHAVSPGTAAHESILVAQETTVYGQDIYGEKSLHKLLKELCQIKGIRWIRLLYCYPEEITDELIDEMLYGGLQNG